MADDVPEHLLLCNVPVAPATDRDPVPEHVVMLAGDGVVSLHIESVGVLVTFSREHLVAMLDTLDGKHEEEPF